MYDLDIKKKAIDLYRFGLCSRECSLATGAKISIIQLWVKNLGISRSISESKKGRAAWNKGKKTPDNIKEKISIKLKGRVPWHKGKKTGLIPKSAFQKGFTPWNKGLKGYKAGNKNNRWKGGVTPKNKLIRESDKYKQWRRDVFVRDQFTCQECGHRFIGIISHHIKSFSDYPDFRFELDNGQTLCRSCHCKLHKPSVKA